MHHVARALLLLCASCGDPITLTVVVPSAPLRAADKLEASAVAQAEQGQVLSGKTAGIFGNKAFYRVEGERYIEAKDVLPHPLKGVTRFVTERGGLLLRLPVAASGPTGATGEALAMGAAVEVYAPLSVRSQSPVLRSGAIVGWVSESSLSDKQPSPDEIYKRAVDLFEQSSVEAATRFIAQMGAALPKRDVLGKMIAEKIVTTAREGDLEYAKLLGEAYAKLVPLGEAAELVAALAKLDFDAPIEAPPGEPTSLPTEEPSEEERRAAFDAALASKDFARAFAAVTSGTHGRILVWAHSKDEKAIDAEEAMLTGLIKAVEPAITGLDLAVNLGDRFGFFKGENVITLGQCSNAPYFDEALLGLLEMIAGPNKIVIEKLRKPSTALGLKNECLEFAVGYETNCEQQDKWEVASQSSVDVGKQKLEGYVVKYSTSDCGDGANEYKEVLGIFLLRGADGRIKAIDQISSPSKFAAHVSLEPKGKGLRWNIDSVDPSCANGTRFERYDVWYDVTAKGNALKLGDEKRRRTEKGKCAEPSY